MIKAGDRVRSFDFPHHWDFPDPKDTSDNPAPTHRSGFSLEGDRACYVEGVVTSIGPHPRGGWKVYFISVDRDVFSGMEKTGKGSRVGEQVFPPVEVVSYGGGETSGVELVAKEVK